MLFPLVTRAFGLVAGMFGVMVVRTDDREVPLAAFARGLYVTAVLHAVGVAGAAKWLLGVHWVSFLGCAGVGIVSDNLINVKALHSGQLATASNANADFWLAV